MNMSLLGASIKYLAVAVALAACCEISIEAATITGVVRDLQGNPLDGVKISITCEHAPDRVEQVNSGEDGAYSFARLLTGKCRISAERSGFETATSAVMVVARESAPITTDFVLIQAHDKDTTVSRPRLKLEAAGIRGLIDPGGYSAPANAAAASGLISGVADIRRTENSTGLSTDRDLPCTLEPELTKNVTANPNNAEANRQLGEFYLAHGLNDQAILYFERARQIEPINLRAIFDLSEALLISGRFDAAREQLSAVPQGAKNVRFHRLLAKVEEGLGHFLEASGEYQIAFERDPSEENSFGIGYELVLAGRPSDATSAFGAGLKTHPLSVTLLIGAGTGKFLQGQSSAAVQLFLQATDANPADPRPYSFLAEAFGISKMEGARVVASLKRHLELFPTDAEAYYFYASILLDEDTSRDVESDQIELLLKQAIALDPNLTKAHFQLGIVYLHRNDYESAKQEFEAAERLTPNNKEVHYRLASAYKKTRRPEAAEREMKLFRDAIEIGTEKGESGAISLEQFISVADVSGHSAVKEVHCPRSIYK
jgi:tetratricopeptide (TPR) repeat protein